MLYAIEPVEDSPSVLPLVNAQVVCDGLVYSVEDLLLILPISDLAGLMRRHEGLLAKLGLWSLRVMKASRLAVMLTRSSISSLLAISLASSSTELAVFGGTFL